MVERGQHAQAALAARLRDHLRRAAEPVQTAARIGARVEGARCCAHDPAGAHPRCRRARGQRSTWPPSEAAGCRDPALTATDGFAGVDAAVIAQEQSASAGRRRAADVGAHLPELPRSLRTSSIFCPTSFAVLGVHVIEKRFDLRVCFVGAGFAVTGLFLLSRR